MKKRIAKKILSYSDPGKRFSRYWFARIISYKLSKQQKIFEYDVRISKAERRLKALGGLKNPNID